MIAIVTAKTPRPILVPDVIGINLPGCPHLGEEIVFVNLLDGIVKLGSARILWITLGEDSGDALKGLGVVGVIAGEHVKSIGFYVRQRAVDLVEGHGEIDGTIGTFVAVRWTIVAIHAIHAAQFGLIHRIGEAGRTKFS